MWGSLCHSSIAWLLGYSLLLLSETLPIYSIFVSVYHKQTYQMYIDRCFVRRSLNCIYKTLVWVLEASRKYSFVKSLNVSIHMVWTNVADQLPWFSIQIWLLNWGCFLLVVAGGNLAKYNIVAKAVNQRHGNLVICLNASIYLPSST